MSNVEKQLGESAAVNENWLGNVVSFLLDSPPAWAEEPTGFNDARPEAVFSGDVSDGLAGYKKGMKIGAAVASGAALASVPAVRTAAAAIGKSAVKAAAKHPTATAVGVGALAASQSRDV